MKAKWLLLRALAGVVGVSTVLISTASGASRCDKLPDGPRKDACQRQEEHRGGGGGGGRGGGGGGAVTITALKLTPSTFKANPGASSAFTTDPTKGTVVTFNLSAAGQVIFRPAVKVANAGRKVRGKCVARTRANRNKAKCTLERFVGTFRYDGVAGANTFRWAGHAGRALKPGKFSLLAQPSTNRRSKAKANFKVTK